MIFVTQGHESGIGLEVFFKAIKEIDHIDTKVKLIIHEDTFKSYKSKKYVEIKNIEIETFSGNDIFQTTKSLTLALDQIKENDILITLPSSKEQFIYDGEITKGHTEFFRKYFKSQNIGMFFNFNESNIFLLTDHIPLKKVFDYINEDYIFDKIDFFLKHSKKYFEFENIYIAGLNPHAGEDGLLGDEEIEITKAIARLNKVYKNVFGPLSGDTLYNNAELKNLLVYLYHDQGLAPFKAVNKYNGFNISIGLPFLRMSVDHGTAFELFDKDIADYSGCKNLIKKAIEIHNGK